MPSSTPPTLEIPDQTARRRSRHPSQLAALETIVYPASDDARRRTTAGRAALEIVPVEAPLTLFVWSTQPDRARPPDRLHASPRRSSTPRSTPSAPRSASGCACSAQRPRLRAPRRSLYMAYQQQKERLAGRRAQRHARRARHPRCHGFDRRRRRRDRPQPLLPRRRHGSLRATGDEVVYLRRRFVPARDRSPCSGARRRRRRPARLIAAPVPRRPRTVLAHLPTPTAVRPRS